MRVRWTRIEGLDLQRYEFDLDLTFAVFFLSPEGDVYGRYGGRDSKSAEARQSVAGLRHAMRAALGRHRDGEGPVPVLRGRKDAARFRFVRDYPAGRRRSGCFHCHQVKEVMIDDLKKAGKWEREMAWRFPLPDQLGFVLDIDDGDRVAAVTEGSPAWVAGLRSGDVLESLGGAVVQSLADAQYGLDHAPAEGETSVVWRRGEELQRSAIKLPPEWKRSNLLWRASMVNFVPVLDLDGEVLGAAERKRLGIGSETLAFKVEGLIPPAMHDAGVRPGDVLVGFGEDEPGDLDSDGIDAYVGSRVQRGDKMKVRVLRGEERIAFTVQF